TDGLLPGADRDLVRPLEARLRKEFEAIHLETRVASLTAEKKGIAAVLEGKASGRELFDRVLVAVGRRPNSQGIGPEDAGVTLGRPEGLTKLIVEPETTRLLGVGLVGAGVGELISEAVVAIEMGAVARDVAESIHPHPTLSETLMEAAELAATGQATHISRPR